MCRTQVTRNDVVVFFSLVIGIVNNQSWMNCWMWVKWNRLRVCDTRCDGVRTSWVDCVWFGYGCICSGVMEWLYSEQRPWIELKPGVWMSSLQRFILLDGCVLWTFALFAFFSSCFNTQFDSKVQFILRFPTHFQHFVLQIYKNTAEESLIVNRKKVSEMNRGEENIAFLNGMKLIAIFMYRKMSSFRDFAH